MMTRTAAVCRARRRGTPNPLNRPSSRQTLLMFHQHLSRQNQILRNHKTQAKWLRAAVTKDRKALDSSTTINKLMSKSPRVKAKYTPIAWKQAKLRNRARAKKRWHGAK